jgi:NAD(P)-dependent dehydrogenase (short-subunit alcohol dehydrogenase family)
LSYDLAISEIAPAQARSSAEEKGMGRVSSKVALITGAGDGIGRATAELFASEGASVFCVSRTASKLEAVVAGIEAAGGRAAYAAADLSRFEGAQQAFDAAMKAHGRIDILVNAAGVGYSWEEKSPGSMAETATCAPEKWREVMAINLDSLFYMCRLVVPQMQAQGRGSIVNVASIYGMMGVPNAHAYTASKGAIINYTRSLAVTYIKDGIRSNCLCPGFVDTGMVASVTPLFKDPAVAKAISPAARPGTPREMAYACLYLGSDEASYCNGSILVADGGSLSQ